MSTSSTTTAPIRPHRSRRPWRRSTTSCEADAQGLLTDRYLRGELPGDSRAAGGVGFLRPEHITEDKLRVTRALNVLAQNSGQSLAQLALRWVGRQKAIASVLIGASKPAQVLEAVEAVRMPPLAPDEIAAAEAILAQA